MDAATDSDDASLVRRVTGRGQGGGVNWRRGQWEAIPFLRAWIAGAIPKGRWRW
jgi:hypothetical protein